MAYRDRAIALALGGYKLVLSPLMHAAGGQAGACRFHPTCSEYAAAAVTEYGIFLGGAMALARLARCHPFCKGGFDPVPPRAANGRAGASAPRPDSAASNAPITIA